MVEKITADCPKSVNCAKVTYRMQYSNRLSHSLVINHLAFI